MKRARLQPTISFIIGQFVFCIVLTFILSITFPKIVRFLLLILICLCVVLFNQQPKPEGIRLSLYKTKKSIKQIKS